MASPFRVETLDAPGLYCILCFELAHREKKFVGDFVVHSFAVMHFRIIALFLLVALSAMAADEFTLYELQPPETHQFAITYDVTATKEGSPYFLNPIRPGWWPTRSG